MMTPEGANLELEFRRLLKLNFDQLFAAHGTFLEKDARETVRTAVKNTFSN